MPVDYEILCVRRVQIAGKGFSKQCPLWESRTFGCSTRSLAGQQPLIPNKHGVFCLAYLFALEVQTARTASRTTVVCSGRMSIVISLTTLEISIMRTLH